MTTLIDEGWLYLTNGTNIMRLACRSIQYDRIWEPDHNHEYGGFNYGYDLAKDYFVIKAGGILFNTTAKKDTFEENIALWQQAEAFTLKIQNKTTPATYTKIGGVYTTLKVLGTKGYSGVHKIAGEGEFWIIEKMEFISAGSISA